MGAHLTERARSFLPEPRPRAETVHRSSEMVRVCATCGKPKAKRCFTKNQWKKGAHARCKQCVESSLLGASEFQVQGGSSSAAAAARLRAEAGRGRRAGDYDDSDDEEPGEGDFDWQGIKDALDAYTVPTIGSIDDESFECEVCGEVFESESVALVHEKGCTGGGKTSRLREVDEVALGLSAMDMPGDQARPGGVAAELRALNAELHYVQSEMLSAPRAKRKEMKLQVGDMEQRIAHLSDALRIEHAELREMLQSCAVGGAESAVPTMPLRSAMAAVVRAACGGEPREGLIAALQSMAAMCEVVEDEEHVRRREELGVLGICKALPEAMAVETSSERVQAVACGAMAALAVEWENRMGFVAGEGAESAVVAMQAHSCDEATVHAACRALAALCEGCNPMAAMLLMECKVGESIIEAMDAHPASVGVQSCGCRAIGNLAQGMQGNAGDEELWGISARVAISKARRTFSQDPVVTRCADAALKAILGHCK